MGTVYCVNNYIFATKDLIFGWVFWIEGTLPSPVKELGDEQLHALQNAFSSPLHADIREALRVEQVDRSS